MRGHGHAERLFTPHSSGAESLIMRRTLLFVGLAGAALVALSADAIRGWFRGGEPNPLPTLVASRGSLVESTVALGILKPQVGAEVKVGSRLSGVVTDLRVGIGDRVRRGDVLAALRDDDGRARLAALAAAVAAAEAEAAFATTQLERNRQLADLVPRQQLDSLSRNLQVREAAVERARASLAEATINVGYSVIRAPVGGTIASISTYVGETVAASFAAPTFLTIVDLDRLEVQAYVDETDIGRVEVGQAVTVRVDAFPGQELPGAVRAIYPKAELINNVVDYVVIVDLRDPHGLLRRPEIPAPLDFLRARRADVGAIPRAALLQEAGESFVVVREGAEFQQRRVETGLSTPQQIEIVSGLAAGETIVADRQAWQERKGTDR